MYKIGPILAGAILFINATAGCESKAPEQAAPADQDLAKAMRSLEDAEAKFIESTRKEWNAPTQLNIVDFDEFTKGKNWQPATLFTDPSVIATAEAVRKGDLTEIDRLLASGVDVNTVGTDGATLLGWAIMTKQKPAFQRLLERGADPNALMNGKMPIIELVAKFKSDSEWLELALKHGGNPNIANKWGDKIEELFRSGGETPIFSAIESHNKRNFDLLVQSGANLNYRNLADDTPLTAAATSNQFQFVFYLLELGADYKIKDNLGHDLPHYVVTAYLGGPGDLWDWREHVIQFLESKGVDFDLESKKIRDSKEPRHQGLYARWEKRLKWLAEKNRP